MNMIILKSLTILMIIHINTCEGMRGHNMTNYIKNVNKAIYNTCNKKAFNITNNIDIYNCIRVNNSNKCCHLGNFTEYNNLRIVCIKNFNGEFGYGIFISIIFWLILGLCFH